jgi:hypothetical protein
VVSAVGKRVSFNAMGQDERDAMQSALDPLHDIVGHVSHCLLPQRDGTLREDYVSTSLLGHLGMMVLLDLRGNKRVIICENEKCKAAIFTDAYQRRYCSDRCRRAMAKRRYRKKRQSSHQDLREKRYGEARPE